MQQTPSIAFPMPAAGSRYSVPAIGVYAMLHVGCLGVFWTGVSLRSLALFGAAFLLRSIAVSVVHHRYFAHRTYRTSRALQFALGLFGTLFVMGGVLWWADTHRRHHRHADTPEDLHSPSFGGFVYAHCGWFLDERHRGIDWHNVRDLARFPELVWLERLDIPLKLVSIACCWAWFGLDGLVWGFFLPTVVVLHMIHCIQSVSHSIGGYRRYPTPDNSRNHWLFGVVSLGEGYHHNHHCFPYSSRLGLGRWELDIGYGLLRLLAALGLVWDLRQPSIEERRGTHPRLTRHVVALTVQIRQMSDGIGDALAAFESASPCSGRSALAEARLRAAEQGEALAGRAAELLIAGPSTLWAALARMQDAVRRDAAALAASPASTGLVARVDAAFAQHRPVIAYEAWRLDGSRARPPGDR